MAEREPRAAPPTFGEPLPDKRKRDKPVSMFFAGEDLPLFSGTPQEVVIPPYVPEDRNWKQPLLPGMPEIDYEHIRELDRQRRSRRRGSAAVDNESGTIWQYANDAEEHAMQEEEQEEDSDPRAASPPAADRLADVLTEYNLSPEQLRQLVALGSGLNEALHQGTAPEEVVHLLSLLSAILAPRTGEQIKSPADVAALLMVEMGYLDQEQLRVVCLDMKNRVQKIHLVYQGSLNTAMIRVGELYKEPLRLNSAAIIVAHNHPSGEPTPSPEDVLVTRQIIDAGKLLDVDCLDHLVIGQGRWVSMRERRLGFDS